MFYGEVSGAQGCMDILRAELYGVSLLPRGEEYSARLAVMTGPPSEGVSPFVLEDHIYFADSDRRGNWLMRRLDVNW